MLELMIWVESTRPLATAANGVQAARDDLDKLQTKYNVVIQLAQQVWEQRKISFGESKYASQVNHLHEEYLQIQARQREIDDRQRRSQTYSSAPDGRSYAEVWVIIDAVKHRLTARHVYVGG